MDKALRTTIFDISDRADPNRHAPQPSQADGVYQALIASGIFSRTNPETVSAISKRLEPVRLSAGRSVDLHSNFGGRLYLIIAGKVKVSLRRPDGCELVLTVRGPGEIFGAVTLFDSHSREVNATTLTEVVAVPIERNQLLVWMAQHPEIRYQVLRLFARWAKATTDALVDFVFADIETRIASRLLCLMKRFGRRDGERVRVMHDLTLNDFCQIVGAAPQTICATLRDFETRGLIRLERDSIVIVDAEALASLRAMNASEVFCV